MDPKRPAIVLFGLILLHNFFSPKFLPIKYHEISVNDTSANKEIR